MKQITTKELEDILRGLPEVEGKLYEARTRRVSDDPVELPLEAISWYLAVLEEVCARELARRPKIHEIGIQADNFRDHAMGVYAIGDGTEVVCEMTYGYSDLYLRDAETHDVIECFFSEELGHKDINAYCEHAWKIRFV